MALQQVERAIEKQFVTYIDYSLPLQLLIFNMTHTPTGPFEINCLTQSVELVTKILLEVVWNKHHSCLKKILYKLVI